MQGLFSETDAEGGNRSRSRRGLMVAGALLLAAVPLSLALFLGDWAYEYRSLSLHEGRLERLLQRQPALAQVEEGLKEEGTRQMAAVSGQDQLRDAAERWGGIRREEVLRKGQQWPQVRVFQAGDVVYVLYFDAGGTMKDFTLVSQ